jgi:hypothetical protein
MSDVYPLTYSKLIPDCNLQFSQGSVEIVPGSHEFGDTVDRTEVFALGHEGKMLLHLVSVLRSGKPETAPELMSNINEVLEDNKIGYPQTVKHWTEHNLEPAGLLKRSKQGRIIYFEPTKKALAALPVTGLFAEIGRRYDLSMIALFSKPRVIEGRADPLKSRLATLRYIFDGVINDRDMTSEELTRAAGYTRSNAAKDAVRRLKDYGIVNLEAWNPTDPTRYGRGESFSAALGDNAKETRRLLVDFMSKGHEKTRAEIDAYLIVESSALQGMEPEDQKHRITSLLRNMWTDDQLDVFELRSNDGSLAVTCTQEQLNLIGQFLEGLHKYSLRDQAFLRIYGALAVDLAHSPTDMNEMYARLARTSNNLLKDREQTVGESVLAVMQSLPPGTTMSVRDVVRAIAEKAKQDTSYRVASPGQIRAAIKGLEKSGGMLCDNSRQTATYSLFVSNNSTELHT